MPPTTIYEFIYYMYSTKVDYHVRNIYMNSMKKQIHVLIEITCLKFDLHLNESILLS